MKVAISDTSPITNLLAINRIEILDRLFERVIIPPAVASELRESHPEIPEFIETISVEGTVTVAGLDELDDGEAEAILLAKQIEVDVLIIDERKGYHVATSVGITCTGLLGVLV